MVMIAATFELPGWTWRDKVLLSVAIVLATVLWSHGVLRRLRPGAPRVSAALPAIVCCWALPCLFDTQTEFLSRIVAVYLGGWLGVFKLFSFSLNRGPLLRVQTFAQHLAVLLLPIYPTEPKHHAVAPPPPPPPPSAVTASSGADKEGVNGGSAAGGQAAPPPAATPQSPRGRGRLHHTAGGSESMLRRFVAKSVLLVVVVGLLAPNMPSPAGGSTAAALQRSPQQQLQQQQQPRLHPILLHALYTLGLYAFLGLLMDGPAALACSACGLTIAPTFDCPWFSVSLNDFWSRRWNIATSSLLRVAVYDIVIEGRLVRPPKEPKAGASSSSGGRSSSGSAATVVGTAAAVAGAEKQLTDGVRAAAAASASSAGLKLRLRNGSARGAKQGEAVNGGDGHAAAPSGSNDSIVHHSGAGPRPSKLRRCLGVLAAFGASGIAHEVILWAVQPDGRWSGKWFAFFTCQAPLLMAESELRSWAKHRRRPALHVPDWLSRVLTLATLELLASWLFFPPVDTDSDVAARTVAACAASIEGLRAWMRPLAAT